MLDSFCIKPISSACLTPVPPCVIGSVKVLFALVAVLFCAAAIAFA